MCEKTCCKRATICDCRLQIEALKSGQVRRRDLLSIVSNIVRTSSVPSLFWTLIMCSGDLTIEWAKVERDASRTQVDGWGVSHQCKDPGAIRAWMKAYHGPDKGSRIHLHDWRETRAPFETTLVAFKMLYLGNQAYSERRDGCSRIFLAGG